MNAKNENQNRLYRREELLPQLAGGMSLRKPQKTLPDPESLLPIHTEALELVKGLCNDRSFRADDIWERVLMVIQSHEINETISQISETALSGDLGLVSLSPEAVKTVVDRSNELNVPSQNLLFAAVFKLDELLHICDTVEFEAMQWTENALRGVQRALQIVSDRFEGEWYNLTSGVSSNIEKALDLVMCAQQGANDYLLKHAVPPSSELVHQLDPEQIKHLD